jgi:predicted ATPase/DNA-binding CsgD family transcriptional regulator
LAALLELLDNPLTRLVTLTGRSGVGKTRLALEVGWAFDDDAPGSVSVVSLANVHEPELVLAEMAAQLEVPALPGQPLAAALMHWLGRFPLLLVVDNFEHVLGAATRLNDLLDGCAELTLLVTSQAPLHLRAERVVRLAPLPVPPEGALELADIVDQPAVTLYCDRARAVNDRFRLDATNAGAVAALCRELEGLPLAIELAAARAATVPAGEVLTRLPDRRLEVLRSPRVDALDRHQDLRGAVSWTFQLLPGPEQDLLRRLSVIGAPFEVDDAEGLAGGELGGVLDGLSALVDLHLVEAVAVGDIASFGLTPSIRDFAREELAATGDLGVTEGAWTSWLAGRARLAAKGLFSPGADAWWDWVDRAHDRLLRALQVCLARERADEALDLVDAVAPHWVNRAVEPTHRQLLETAIGMAEQRGMQTSALAQAWTWSALLGLRVLTPEGAELLVERLERAEQLARSLADDSVLLLVLDSWTRVPYMTGDRERAMAALAEGLELAGRVGATCWLARLEVQSGRSLTRVGDDERALAAGLSGLAHARQAGDTTAVLQAATLLQPMAHLYPEVLAALPSPEELLELARTAHQTASAAVLLPTFSVQAVASGDLPAAARWCREGLQLYGLDPSAILTAFAVFAAVEIAAARGDHELAARLHGRFLGSERLLRASTPRNLDATHQAVIAGARNALGEARFAAQVAAAPSLPWSSMFQELDAYLADIGALQPVEPASLDKVRAARDQQGLTGRQQEVVQLLARGLTNKEIARTLGVTQKTAMHHTVAIYQKLGLRGRSEAVAWAFRTGLAQDPG